jgi:hypothetical protein
VIDTQGDSFFVAFRSSADALLSAVEIQRALAAHRWPEGAEVRVRIAIHSGEASATDERYLGFSVHRAARVGAADHGGQVLVSDSTRSLVEDDLPEGVFLRDLGSHRLKDIDRPERISQLAADGLRLEFPPLRGAEPVKPPPVLRHRSLLAASVLRSLGYKAQLKFVPSLGAIADSRRKIQASAGGWFGDYPPADAILSPSFTYQSFTPNNPTDNNNWAEFCNHRIDAEIDRARTLEANDRQAAIRLWSKIDRDITNQAPWVTIFHPLTTFFLSRRASNHTYCFVGGICLDQLWVR